MTAHHQLVFTKLLNPVFFIMPLDRRKVGKTTKSSFLLLSVLPLFFILSTSSCVGAQQKFDVQCPSQCTCTFAQKLVNCSNRSLRQIPQPIPSWVSLLTFRNNKIAGSEIKGEIFKNLTNLQELIFSDNHLTHVTLDIKNVPRLRTLRFDRCTLHRVPNVSSATASNITTLTLSHNSIQDLGKRLKRWSSLRTLDVSFNRIRHLKNGTFSHQKNLTELYLHRNKITRIDSHALDGVNRTLETLSLNRNRIRFPPRFSSSSILGSCSGNQSNLKFLDLSRNQISQVQSLAFSGLCSLKTLLLNGNRISKLHDGSFFNLKALLTLNLDDNQIKKISMSWLYELKSLERLSLYNNNVSQILPDSWKLCKETKFLNLSGNNMAAISKGLFQQLTKLEQLDLSRNQIEVVSNDAFLGLAKLHFLDLSHNGISSTVEAIEGAFNGLPYLKTLLLNDNRIRTLSSDVLRGARGLRSLDLRNNNLTSVQNGTFSNHNKLLKLFIDSSSFMCDCQLSWFVSWIQGRRNRHGNFSFVGNPLCFHPPTLKGRAILEIDERKLECGANPNPALLQQPSFLSSYRGENVTLECSASATLTGSDLTNEELSKVHMSVVWKRGPADKLSGPNHVISTSRSIKILNTQRRESGHIFFTSFLFMYEVTYDDEQVYSCVVSNKFGHAESVPAKLRVFDLPQITRKPPDKNVREGQSVIFDCRVAGHPLPDVTWEKDGGQAIHAAKEDRLIHKPAIPTFERGNAVQVSLHIKDVKPRDAGVYSCIANNEVGRARSDAVLTVLYPPVVTPMITPVRAAAGSPAVFKCMAHSHPAPTIVWLKDGGPLNTTERHFFAANRQVLVVSEVGEDDVGMYTCEVSNDMGMKRSQTELVLGLSDGWDLLGSEGMIVITVFSCLILATWIWLIFLCYARRNPESAPSTQTEQTYLADQHDVMPFDSSSRDSLDHPRPCMTSNRPDVMEGRILSDQCPPDLLSTATMRSSYHHHHHYPPPANPHHRSHHPHHLSSLPRTHDRVLPPPNRFLAPGPVRGTHDDVICIRTPLHRPPLRAHSTSHMNRMLVDPPRPPTLPAYNSMHCLQLHNTGTERARANKTTTKVRKKRRRRRAQTGDPPKGSSKRAVTSSSDSETGSEVKSLMSGSSNVWRMRNNQHPRTSTSPGGDSNPLPQQSTVLLSRTEVGPVTTEIEGGA